MKIPAKDIVYLRYAQDGVVTRVARVDLRENTALALYPTSDSDVFDTGPQTTNGALRVARSQLADEIWTGLLDGKSREELLRDRQHYHDNVYSFCPRGADILECDSGRFFEIRELIETAELVKSR